MIINRSISLLERNEDSGINNELACVFFLRCFLQIIKTIFGIRIKYQHNFLDKINKRALCMSNAKTRIDKIVLPHAYKMNKRNRKLTEKQPLTRSTTIFSAPKLKTLPQKVINRNLCWTSSSSPPLMTTESSHQNLSLCREPDIHFSTLGLRKAREPILVEICHAFLYQQTPSQIYSRFRTFKLTNNGMPKIPTSLYKLHLNVT